MKAVKAITHRDQIHGDVRFDPLSVELLKTDALQRLGRVYQLGYAHLVYRGGTHTRLSHVMGASHVAGELVALLRQNYLEASELPRGAVPAEKFLPVSFLGTKKLTDDTRWEVLQHLVRWAALLHDIGHVPLGHTLEDEFDGIYTKHDDFASPRIPHLWHEVSPGNDSEIRRVFRREELLPESFRALGISGEQVWHAVMLICLHKENKEERLTFGNILDKQDENKIQFIRILKDALKNTQNRIFFPYMADIVGNTICADYLDYLRRDPTNVGLDVLRDDRVASRFFIGKDATDSFRMALALVDRGGKPKLDTCTGVVELVRQRFRFAEIIYYHKTKVAASAMLAKAFARIGQPQEVGPSSVQIDIANIDKMASLAAVEGPRHVEKLREQSFPSNLLNPEIGDETLLLWLQEKAWKEVESASLSKNEKRIAELLSGVALLQAISRRNLYKVCLTIDRTNYEELSPGSKEAPEIERRIQATLQLLRKDPTKRDELEARMASAASWPIDSLLLYVPPRKSQAKGIETGALDRGDVITLGTHSAVKEEVARLSDAYKKLWRMILLVHPSYREDAVGLSKALDVLLQGIWPDIDVSAVLEQIRKAAWFPYIAAKERSAAAKYQSLINPEKPNWKHFETAASNTTDGTVSTDEHAYRALLVARVIARGGSVEHIKEKFTKPNSLSQRLLEIEPQLTVEGRDGLSDKDRSAIELIARELFPDNDVKDKPRSLFKTSK